MGDSDAAAVRLRLRADIQHYVVEDEGTFFISEGDMTFIEGELLARTTPLLDGSRTREDIVTSSTGPWSADDVREALDALVEVGYVVTDDASVASWTPDAGLYEHFGVPLSVAIATLRVASVTVAAVGSVSITSIVNDLRTSGVGEIGILQQPSDIGGSTSLGVVVTDSYLHPAIATINAAALESDTPWLLTRPVGVAKWIGPYLRPPDTACWECLAHRIRVNRHEESYLQRRLDQSAPVGAISGRHRLSDRLGGTLVALEVIRILLGLVDTAPAIVSIDPFTAELERHVVTRRPQCPACGDPTLVARHGAAPVMFSSLHKATTVDGGHRAISPEKMVEQYESQVSPISGIVTTLRPAAMPVDGLHVYSSGQNMAAIVPGSSPQHRGLRTLSSGKGMSDAQARASALGEAIERSSIMFQGDEPRRRARFSDLGDDAVHPNDLLLFSERQFQHRAIWNLGASQFNHVCEPFDDDASVEWSPVWSVSQSRARLIPTQLIYFGYPPTESPWHAVSDSNGCAAGTSLEDAVLQGFCELVERDSVALWWYNRVQRPAIDLTTCVDPYVQRVIATYASLHREVWALDLTSDLGIPAVGAFSRAVDGPSENILIAFAAHLDPMIALQRALGEMNQFLPGVHQTYVNGQPIPQFDDPTFLRWCEMATLDSQPHLVPDSTEPARDIAQWPTLSTDNFLDDLLICQRAVESAGLEMLVMDLTRPDVGLPVVKVIVPGLRHFWPRYAPGRLYDVPVALQWVDAPTAEEDLNPFPIFI